MKALVLSLAACAICLTSPLRAQAGKGPVKKPDLIGSIQQLGAKLVITVENATLGSGGVKALRSTAKLTLDGQSQIIQVPELAPDGEFTKEVPIPASLLTKAFVGTLKVDQANVVAEASETNNTFTATFNLPDLAPVLVDGKAKFRIDGAFWLISVKNIGTANSGSFSTKVTYGLLNGQTQTEQGLSADLPAGATIEVKVPAPPSGCFHPDCFFKVEVDPNNAVKELLKTNNAANGLVVG